MNLARVLEEGFGNLILNKLFKDEIELNSPKKIKAVDIKTMPYPRISNWYAISNGIFAHNF